MIGTWQNEDEVARCVNTERPLTRPLDLREEGLAMQATRVCSVTDCDSPHYGLGLCRKHYQRRARTGSTAGQPQRPTVCTLVDCNAEHFGHGWCQRHYTRWRKTGDPLGLRRPAIHPACSIDECDRPSRARAWCEMHYGRWLRTGSPLTVRPNVITPPGPLHPSWRGTEITYASAHRRIVNAKGSAARHACVGCGRPAKEWSYDHQDPDELIGSGPRKSPFSIKPEHYLARCVRCHRQFDMALRRPVSA